MKTILFKDLEVGQNFRFKHESESTVRYVSQKGRTEIYCPKIGQNTFGHSMSGGEEVYLKSDVEVFLVENK